MRDEQSYDERLTELENSQKEREPSFLRAVKTLSEDLHKYSSGNGDEFPTSAILGVIFAYLRPRLILTFAGIGAVFIGGIQVWLLTNQNQLLEAQNNLFLEQNQQMINQSRTNAISSIAAIMSNTSATKDYAAGTAQLKALGDQGIDVLINLLNIDTPEWTDPAMRALVGSVNEHSVEQSRRALTAFYRYASDVVEETAEMAMRYGESRRWDWETIHSEIAQADSFPQLVKIRAGAARFEQIASHVNSYSIPALIRHNADYIMIYLADPIFWNTLSNYKHLVDVVGTSFFSTVGDESPHPGPVVGMITILCGLHAQSEWLDWIDDDTVISHLDDAKMMAEKCRFTKSGEGLYAEWRRNNSR